MKNAKESLHDKNWAAKRLASEISDSNKSIISVLPDVSSALDVGCGRGELMLFLKKKGIRVFGLDISGEALRTAKNRGLRVKRADMDSPLPFKANSFDVCISNQVLMHLFEPARAVSEMKRVSKKYVLINVPNHSYWKFRLSFLFGAFPEVFRASTAHIRMFNYNSAKRILEKEGLSIIRESVTGRKIFPSFFATSFTFLCKK